MRYVRAEGRRYDALARFEALPYVAGFALAAVIAVVNELGITPVSIPSVELLFILKMSVNSIFVLLVFSLLGLKLGGLRRNPFYLFTALACASTAGAWPFVNSISNGTLRMTALVAIPLLCALSWSYLKLASLEPKNRRAISVLYSGLFLGLVASVSIFSLSNVQLGFFRYFWTSKMIFLWLSSMTFAYAGSFEDGALMMLNPTHSFRGALWPEQSLAAPSEELGFRAIWWRGWFNLLLAIAIFGGLLAIEQFASATRNLFVNYIEFFMVDIAAFNFLTGASRVFGYQVQDATRFLFLARTPADTWRRGSVYNYIFILRYIYFPILRVARSPLLATIFAFTFFSIAHWGGSFILSLTNTSAGAFGFESKLVMARIAHAFLYAVSVYVTARVWFVSQERLANSAVLQWVSILMTHAVFLIFVYVIYVWGIAMLSI